MFEDRDILSDHDFDSIELRYNFFHATRLGVQNDCRLNKITEKNNYKKDC